MKIIEKGEPKTYKVVCPACGCKFECCDDDRDYMGGSQRSRHAECPQERCHNKVDINNLLYGQPQ